MKKILFTILLLAIVRSSLAYDFWAVCSTGQKLYYNIMSDSTAEITFCRHYSFHNHTLFFYDDYESYYDSASYTERVVRDISGYGYIEGTILHRLPAVMPSSPAMP